MKTILIIAHEIPKGGVGVSAYEVAKTLADLGNDVYLVLPEGEEFQTPENLAVIYMADREEQSVWKTLGLNDKYKEARLADIIQLIKPDIIHIYHFLKQSINYIEVAKKAGVPCVVSIRDATWFCPQWHLLDPYLRLCEGPETIDKCVMCVTKHGRKELDALSLDELKDCYGILHLRSTILTGALATADRIISISKFMQDKLHKYTPIDNDVLIPSGIEEFEAKPKTPSDILRFGFFGHIIPHKGVGTLLEAWQGINEEYGNQVSLTLYGGKYTQIQPEFLIGTTEYGPYRIQEIPDLYANVDVAIFPTLTECRPRGVREAFMAETPVICSDIPPMLELVDDGKDAIVFDAGSASGLQIAMQEVIQYPEKIQQMRENIKKPRTVKEEVEDLLVLYDEVING
jgi:glycosyltransferase involved in cell wall biosynthesis